jgi:hypothetical protein
MTRRPLFGYLLSEMPKRASLERDLGVQGRS